MKRKKASGENSKVCKLTYKLVSPKFQNTFDCNTLCFSNSKRTYEWPTYTESCRLSAFCKNVKIKDKKDQVYCYSYTKKQLANFNKRLRSLWSNRNGAIESGTNIFLSTENITFSSFLVYS